jgi:hypothetical protein
MTRPSFQVEHAGEVAERADRGDEHQCRAHDPGDVVVRCGDQAAGECERRVDQVRQGETGVDDRRLDVRVTADVLEAVAQVKGRAALGVGAGRTALVGDDVSDLLELIHARQYGEAAGAVSAPASRVSRRLGACRAAGCADSMPPDF